MPKALKEAGYWVRALSRTEEKGEAIRPFVDELLIGEATNPASLMDVDYQANKNVLDNALAVGVNRFMYISALNADTHIRAAHFATAF